MDSVYVVDLLSMVKKELFTAWGNSILMLQDWYRKMNVAVNVLSANVETMVIINIYV